METMGLNLSTPTSDEDFFNIARWLLTRSTCLKTQTAALIVQGGHMISHGVNMCCPQGQLYGLPVPECPRMDKATGTWYELCKPLHAEVDATLNALGISAVERKSLWHLPSLVVKLMNYTGYFKNATLYLVGHYWACDECLDFLKVVGIVDVKFDDLSGGKTRGKYAASGLLGHTANATVLGGVVTVKLKTDTVGALASFLMEHRVHEKAAARLVHSPELILIDVAVGEEASRLEAFRRDPNVAEAGVLLTQVK